VQATVYRDELVWRDLATGRAARISEWLPANLTGVQVNGRSALAVSGNEKSVVFRSELGLGTSGGYALSWHGVEQAQSLLITLRTNPPVRQVVPAIGPLAEVSEDGRFVAYSVPLPYDPAAAPASQTNGPSQVYLWDAETQTPLLVSTATDGLTPANDHSLGARISADGRFVAFLSLATNLVEGTPDSRWRAYWWERLTGQIPLAGKPDASRPPDDWIIGWGGSRFALSKPPEAGTPVFAVVDAASGQVQTVVGQPAVTESATSRSGVAVEASGISSDGRYVAMLAFPRGEYDTTAHLQVYLLDTQTGTRQWISQGVDGQPGNGNPSTPFLSADGTRLVYPSAATNLVAGDTNRYRDVFVFDGADPSNRLLPLRVRPPGSFLASPDILLNPEGRYLVASFSENGPTVTRILDLDQGVRSAALPGTRATFGPSASSRDGARLVVKSGTPTFIVIDVPEWFASGGTRGVLHTELNVFQPPALSPDGQRVAFVRGGVAPALVVRDLPGQRDIFQRSLRQGRAADLAFSEDGRFLVWQALSTVLPLTPFYQVWRADLDSGAVVLASVAPNGSDEGNGSSKQAAVSPDGRFVAFASLADNLVPGDANRARDVFLRDLETGRTLLVSRTPAGSPGDGWSLRPFFSRDGRCLFFLSHAANLAPGDHNHAVDLFKVSLLNVRTGSLLVLQRNLTTGQARLLWTATPGKSYRVQFKDDLNEADWQSLTGSFAGDTPVDVGATVGASRFFRLVELP
jgi:Tol biopolymer transport system component